MVKLLICIIFLSVLYAIACGMVLQFKKTESLFSPISGTFMFYIVLIGMVLILFLKLFFVW